jgi:hypothetical protein
MLISIEADTHLQRMSPHEYFDILLNFNPFISLALKEPLPFPFTNTQAEQAHMNFFEP